MRLIRVLAYLALSLLGASAFAQSCTRTTSLGQMGPPDLAYLGNSFNSAGNYSDCYNFSLGGPATSFGGAIELNTLLNKLEIDVASVALYAGGSQVGIDYSPLAFSFGALAGGVTYTLAVAGSVAQNWGLFDGKVGYSGLFATHAAPVPEPSAYALALLGLLGVGLAVRRKQRR